ncbi:MAG: HAMP domain-containing sensor histidine kinase [Polyangiaceae bacterium]
MSPQPTRPPDNAYDQLATMGEVAAESAHELQNALHVIAARAFLARVDAARGATDTAVAHIALIEESAHHAHAIVDDLMCLARQEAIRSELVSLPYVLQEARRDLSDRCARWDDRVEPAGLNVKGHGTLLVRMLHALYENAIHASSPRLPVIATEVRLLDDDIVLDVTDDGPGVPAELRDRLFDPLFTTRRGGTGLGLALARRIVRAHGGSIDLCRRDGLGATFRVALPAA